MLLPKKLKEATWQLLILLASKLMSDDMAEMWALSKRQVLKLPYKTHTGSMSFHMAVS